MVISVKEIMESCLLSRMVQNSGENTSTILIVTSVG
jgi:hypothetical protein